MCTLAQASLFPPLFQEPVMRTKRMMACLVTSVMAFGAFTVAATTTFTSGHSTLKGHTLTQTAAIDSSSTLRGPGSTYWDD
jgi:hypothetical protein